MSRPLRSTPITRASPLLRAGPPAGTASVLSVSGFRRTTRSLSPTHATRARTGSIGTRLPTFHAGAADRARAAYTPDTAWPTSGHPPGSSRRLLNSPVLMSSWLFRRFLSGSLALAFPPGRRPESHRPPPTDPDVSLSAHPARAVQCSGVSTAAPSARTGRVPVAGLPSAIPALVCRCVSAACTSTSPSAPDGCRCACRWGSPRSDRTR